MMTADLTKYFPHLSTLQLDRLHSLEPIYREWNAQINVISRKDIEELTVRHILHSLGIAKVLRFQPGTTILDVGTGGGFPGIPLAIIFPECQFTLIDSIGKKIKVVQDVARQLELSNVASHHTRVQELKGKFDFVVSRAVTAFPAFVSMVSASISVKSHNALPNGIIYLKGGDFADEIKQFGNSVQVFDLSNFFEEPFFETKKVIYLPR